jgi:hypothetical protein
MAVASCGGVDPVSRSVGDVTLKSEQFLLSHQSEAVGYMERRCGYGMAVGSCGGVNPLHSSVGDMTLKSVPIPLFRPI